MSESTPNPEELQSIFKNDQRQRAIPEAAAEIARFFHELRHHGLTEEHALEITKTWIIAHLRREQP